MFFLPSNYFARQNLRRTKGKYRWTDSFKCQQFTVKNGVNAPIKANAPGRLKSQKHAKNGANAPGRLDLFYFIEKRLGRSFSRFFEMKAPWSEPTTREGVRKVANPARGELERENISLSPFAPESLVSRDGFSRPVPRQAAHSLYSG